MLDASLGKKRMAFSMTLLLMATGDSLRYLQHWSSTRAYHYSYLIVRLYLDSMHACML